MVRVDGGNRERKLHVRPRLPQIVAGDRVGVLEDIVVAILPRETLLERADPRRPGQREPIVANVDLAVVIASVGAPPLRPRLIDRYRVALADAGIGLAIAVNKTENLSELEIEQTRHELRGFGRAGVPILLVSAETGAGVPDLRELLSGHTAVFLGHSGVGKSSLLNALAGEEVAETGAVSADTGKGKHTTRTSRRIRLDANTTLIDTPGVRSFGIDAEPILGFPEFAPFAAECRFRNCAHDHEPDCAVQTAVREGKLDPARYASYRRLISAETDDEEPDPAGFTCAQCGQLVCATDAGSRHRNHCPYCLCSRHLDVLPGDRDAACGAVMDPVAVWVRKAGEWAVIHRCRDCGVLHSNRIAADDHPHLLLSIAVRPIGQPPFPLWQVPTSTAVAIGN